MVIAKLKRFRLSGRAAVAVLVAIVCGATLWMLSLWVMPMPFGRGAVAQETGTPASGDGNAMPIEQIWAQDGPLQALLKQADQLAAEGQLTEAERCRHLIELWKEAMKLGAEGRQEEAAQRWQTVMAENPGTDTAQEAACRAGLCMAGTARWAEAISFYDQAIAIYEADTTIPEDWVTMSNIVQARRRNAWYYKAQSCYWHRQLAEARQTVQLLQAAFPDFSEVSEFGLIEAKLGLQSLAQAQQVHEREQAATELFNQGRQAQREKRYADALPILDRVVADYPGTAAAWRVLEKKAYCLEKLERYEEAKDVCRTILRQLGPESQDA